MSESEGEAAPRAQFELVTVKVEPCTFDDDDSTHGMDLRLRSSPKQILKLIEFMESNFDLARPEPGPQGKLRAERLWQDLTDILNSAGKAQKSTDKWKRVWADWKSKTKKKALTIKWDISLRGGSRQSLCVLEERVLRIMGLSKLIRPSGAAERGHQSNCHSSKNPPTATLPRPQSPPRLIELKFENHPLEEVVMKTPPATPPPPTPPPAPPLRRAGRSRRRVMTPLERAALRLVAVEERRLRMEERRDRRQHEREVEREQMHNEREMERLRVESQRLQVESRRNELLQCLADIPHILVELLAQPRPTIPNGP